MDLQLKAKHVLLTGGTRGIGLACARGFLREGARASIVGRSQAHLDEALAALRAEGFSVDGYTADLIDAQAALAMVDAVEIAGGPIDVLVNSAGAARRTPFGELEPRAWQDAMQAKFFSYINVMDPVIKRMGARGAGAIVNVVGMGGKIATPTHIAGGAANAALMLASAGLAAAYAARGIRVNAVNPAFTLTDRLAEGLAADARLRGVSEEEALRQVHARAPLGRLATPEDIADAVVFLASPRAGYISAAILSMDGSASPMVV
ncbi:MAG: 3-oxoacyl-ACP reductase [Frankiales bacterium]|nr:3-oxoacyl-ACP reductase [Frankiales bacterium]